MYVSQAKKPLGFYFKALNLNSKLRLITYYKAWGLFDYEVVF